MSSRGVFITLEGGEGTGKSTQMSLIDELLRGAGLSTLAVREPGSTVVGEALREIVLDPRHTGLCDRTEVLLYVASRAQHTDEVIRPALAAGKVVICDRYIDSSVAYQGYGRGLPLEEVRALNEFATGGLLPDVTLLFDIDPQTGLGRATAHGADRLEAEEAEFHDRVRNGYLEMAELQSDRFVVIDGTGTPQDVFERARGAISRIPVIALSLGAGK